MTIRPLTLTLLLATGVSVAEAEGELAGTSWKLVEIQSMDDTSEAPAPDAQGRYTLEFTSDEDVLIQADCNRGTATWSSETPGQLQFGPIAATQALCPPESLHDSYMTQLAWVRSYVMEDGHLFLATMTDGSIIELEPAASATAPVATVLGEEIPASPFDETLAAIMTPLFQRYAEENGIVAEESEIGAWLAKKERDMRATMGDEYAASRAELTPEEAAEVADLEHDMAAGMIHRWKLNKSLYEQYGGRVVGQQLGPEPMDAYKDYLREREKAGDLVIHDADFERQFWAYFDDENRHDFLMDDGAVIYSTMPWVSETEN